MFNSWPNSKVTDLGGFNPDLNAAECSGENLKTELVPELQVSKFDLSFFAAIADAEHKFYKKYPSSLPFQPQIYPIHKPGQQSVYRGNRESCVHPHLCHRSQSYTKGRDRALQWILFKACWPSRSFGHQGVSSRSLCKYLVAFPSIASLGRSRSKCVACVHFQTSSLIRGCFALFPD